LPTLERRVEQERLEKERALAEAMTQIARLKKDKDEQSKAVQDKLLTLTEKLDKLDKPWWKKLLSKAES